MAGSLDTNDLLVPRVRRAEIFGRLRLTAGKAAELCGITRRQLCYWTDKGIIPCCTGGNNRDPLRRIYDFNGLSKALMLKRIMDEGRGLRRAVRELKARWVEPAEVTEDDRGVTEEHALLAQAERLTRLGEKARQVGARRDRRETLVALVLSLRPLAALCEDAAEARTAFAGSSRCAELKALLGETERTVGQLSKAEAQEVACVRAGEKGCRLPDGQPSAEVPVPTRAHGSRVGTGREFRKSRDRTAAPVR